MKKNILVLKGSVSWPHRLSSVHLKDMLKKDPIFRNVWQRFRYVKLSNFSISSIINNQITNQLEVIK